MKHSRMKKISFIILILFILLALASTIYVKTSTYSATEEALQVSHTAKSEKGYDVYTSGKESQIGIVFYPGAFVKPESYSLWADEVAKAGYDVYVVHFPINLAVMKVNAAEQVMADHPKQQFVLAGHSLGGVMASRFVAQHEEDVSGMIFLASYPDKKGAIKNGLPVLSLTGTNDGVIDWNRYEKAKQYLPKDTQYLKLKGANHAGFGSYGAQKGDQLASISNQQQQMIISQTIVSWLAQEVK
jgi:Lysophospholipase